MQPLHTCKAASDLALFSQDYYACCLKQSAYDQGVADIPSLHQNMVIIHGSLAVVAHCGMYCLYTHCSFTGGNHHVWEKPLNVLRASDKHRHYSACILQLVYQGVTKPFGVAKAILLQDV